MKRANLLINAGWQLFGLHKSMSNLIFYVDAPGDETGTDGWVNAMRSEVQQRFASAIDAEVLTRDELVRQRSHALSLVSLLNANPGATRADWGLDLPLAITAVRAFVAKLESLLDEHDEVKPEVSEEITVETPPKPPAQWDKATEDRNKWLYDQCCKIVPYSTIEKRLSKKPKWGSLTINGIKNAANAHAKRHNKTPIPPRQNGRPKKK